MKTDLELLEAARIAAGISGGHWDGRVYRTASGNSTWAPLDDDGDACRLITGVPLSVDFNHEDHTIHVLHGRRLLWEAVWVSDADRPEVTRRALVLAAAALGEPQA